MVVAVAKAVEDGAEVVLCASTGNTAASAAAYAARAGVGAVVLLPGGGTAVAAAKVAQALAYGARAIAIEGNFDHALEIARQLAERHPIALVNSVNPHRLAGQQTAAWEIVEVLGDAPDVLALPVGNGGNISAYWAGFRRWHEDGRTQTVPRLLGAQAAGAAPLVLGHPVDHPETICTAIRIGRPASRELAIAAVRESHGAFRAAGDGAILEASRQLSRLEGIFCEPSSAAGIAALRASVAAGETPSASRCVVVCTGHGLKDPTGALTESDRAPRAAIPATVEAVARALGWSVP
jgi:threonine synthase